MGCDFPLTAYRSQEWNPGTKRYGITFNPIRALNSTNPFNVPCGRCAGCRLERSRQWAVRCMHEAQLHQENCFITLTFSNEHLPIDYSVNVRDLQLFMKKLRKQQHPKTIRFLASGEYGDTNLRPHYHLVIFGHDYQDKVHYETTPRGDRLYVSKSLSQIWPYGLSTIGNLTFESAAYTARYAMKKLTGELAETGYLREHPLHHFICRVRPEFLVMSRGGRDGQGGIGSGWYEKFGQEAFQHDSVIVRGKEQLPPRFYLNKLPEEEKKAITVRRTIKAKANPRARGYTAETARAEVRDARISTLTRKL